MARAVVGLHLADSPFLVVDEMIRRLLQWGQRRHAAAGQEMKRVVAQQAALPAQHFDLFDLVAPAVQLERPRPTQGFRLTQPSHPSGFVVGPQDRVIILDGKARRPGLVAGRLPRLLPQAITDPRPGQEQHQEQRRQAGRRPPSQPAPTAFGDPHPPRPDRLEAQEAVQVVGQLPALP